MKSDDVSIDVEVRLSIENLRKLFQEYGETLPTNDDDETYLDSKSRWECEAGGFLGWLEQRGILDHPEPITVDADEKDIARIQAAFEARYVGLPPKESEQ